MKRLILIVLSFFSLTTPALAKDNQADMWIVSQRSGDARVVHRGIQPASLTVSSALAPGDVVITGASGRATLARGSDYIVIAPRSELRLPASVQASGFTRVVQQLGTMLYKVKHTGVPHFAVDTPMLAAVVKGTTFTVVVDRDRSAVQVIQGVVQVTAAEGGMQRLVEGGATVFIDRNNPKALITADVRSLGASETSSETSVKVSGSEGESVSAVADLTGGLVQAEPVALAATSPAIVKALIAPVASTGGSGTAVQPVPGTAVDAPAATGAPIVTPIVDTVVTPVVDAVVTPVVDTVVAPVVTTVVAPIVTPVVTTVVAPIVTTVVAPIVTPIVTTVVAPVIAVVAPIVAPVVAPIVAPVVAPVLTVVAPVVAPILTILPPLFGR